MKTVFSATLLTGVICAAGCTGEAPVVQTAYPLLDGSCSEYTGSASERHTVADGVDLYVFQDHAYVWLCYTYPEGSYGTVDMELSSPGQPETLNLHVSGQVGEWPLGRDDLAPDSPESDRWWNQEGWMSNPVWPNGMDRSGDTPRYLFKNDPAREIQLSKARFGAGEWRFRLRINGIRNDEDEYVGTVFPADDEEYRLLVD